MVGLAVESRRWEGSAMVELVLDPSIRDYVVVPITVAMVFYGLLQHHLRVLLTDSPPPKPDDIKSRHNTQRSQRLRANGNMISAKGFEMRKSYFNDSDKGIFIEKNIVEEPVYQDPTAMMGPMKAQMAGMFQFMGMMFLINYFFSGFVCIRLPFTLTYRFKPMLQRGMILFGLDMSWVSSLSWQVLNSFGLRGVHQWILGSDEVIDPFAQQQQVMGGGQAGMPGQPKMKELYKGESTNLSLLEYDGATLNSIEQSFLSS